MVEVAPGGERLRIPVWKYILFLVLFMLLCLGILWYLMASSFGASNSLLETLRRYLTFFSSYHPNLKPEDDFSNALRIHGIEKNEPKKFYMFVSMTDKDGSPIKVINAGRGGDKTPWALTRLVPDVIEKKPDAVSIFLGTNDCVIGRGRWADEPRVSPETYHGNLVWIVYLCRQAGIRKFSITPPLWRFEGAAWAEFGEAMLPYRQAASAVGS